MKKKLIVVMVSMFVLVSSVTVSASPLYRYWNGSHHFYTTDFHELGDGRDGFTLEGIQCQVRHDEGRGLAPLYRYFNSSSGDHFYTTHAHELGDGRDGYTLEGIQGYVSRGESRGAVPLYRYYNSSTGDHFYTTDFNELGNGQNGYIYEEIQCYVWK